MLSGGAAVLFRCSSSEAEGYNTETGVHSGGASLSAENKCRADPLRSLLMTDNLNVAAIDFGRGWLDSTTPRC